MVMRWPVHEGQDDTDALKDWCRRNLMPGSVFYASNHNYGNIAPAASYYGTHPEWYTGSAPSTPWQLDPEDNASLIARGITYAGDWLDTDSGLHQYDYISDDYVTRGGPSFSPRDGGGWEPPYDESDTQKITDVVFDFANQVAAGIAESYPNAKVSLLNYYLHAGIPSFELEPNMIAWVTDGHNYTPFSTKERFEGLAAKGIDTALYQYTAEWVYTKDKPATDSQYNHTKQIGAIQDMGAMAYLSEASDGWGAFGLMMWLMAELTWDSDSDWDDLLGDFYTKAFGPAADNMQSYFESIRTIDNYAMKQAINYLDAAETNAAGNAAVLERIRYLQNYFYFVWKYHNVQICLQRCQLRFEGRTAGPRVQRRGNYCPTGLRRSDFRRDRGVER